MMKPKILLRIAAGCLLFFATGHSMGHFKRHDVTDPQAKEVLRQMMEHKFDMFGQLRSYDENYTGMSLNLIFTLLALTVVVWILAAYSEKQPGLVKQLLVPLGLCILGFSVTGFLYFFPVPAVTCLVAVALIAAAFVKLNDKKEV